MYVWGSWACMYVCLSQTYKICLFRRVSNSSRKTFSIWSPIQFFEICEGGYFQEPSEAPNMYVCMFELQTYPKHVCMYVWQAQASMYVCLRPSEHVCMYVPGSWACMYVCLRLLSKYVCMSQATERVCMLCAERVCMFQVCMYVCLRERRFMYVWMSQTYIHSQARWACMFGMLIFERVCMCQNPVFCRTFCSSNLTQDLKLAFRRHKTGSGISCMSQNLVFCRPLGD